MLKIGQAKLIPERRETNEVSPVIITRACFLHFWTTVQGRESKKFCQVQIRVQEDASAGFRGCGTPEGGHTQRSYNNLQQGTPLSLWLNSKFCIYKMRLQKARQRVSIKRAI